MQWLILAADYNLWYFAWKLFTCRNDVAKKFCLRIQCINLKRRSIRTLICCIKVIHASQWCCKKSFIPVFVVRINGTGRGGASAAWQYCKMVHSSGFSLAGFFIATPFNRNFSYTNPTLMFDDFIVFRNLWRYKSSVS